MRIPVSKYHGCGNDFVIASMNDLQGIDLSHLATAVCDRHTGIGADGFIAVKEQRRGGRLHPRGERPAHDALLQRRRQCRADVRQRHSLFRCLLSGSADHRDG